MNSDLIVRPATAALVMQDPAERAAARAAFARFVGEQLRDGTHYGAIPGTGERKVLLKPGAEEVVRLYGCTATFDVLNRTERFEDPALFAYEVRCRVVSPDGVVRAEGAGTCSSRESKYRWRQEWWRGTGTPPDGEGWRRRGDGWVRRVENPDAADQQNTVRKMADKRALVAAALQLGCASDTFTQDLDDAAEPQAPPPAPKPSATQTGGADRQEPGGEREGDRPAPDRAAASQPRTGASDGKPNKFAGSCVTCGVRVEAAAGYLAKKADGKWGSQCAGCHDGAAADGEPMPPAPDGEGWS